MPRDAINFITLKELTEAQQLSQTQGGIELVNKWLDREEDFSLFIEGYINALMDEYIKPCLKENLSSEKLMSLRREIRDHHSLLSFFMKHIFDSRANKEFMDALGDG
jgi:hypothetical protein